MDYSRRVPRAESMAAHANLIPNEAPMKERWMRELFGELRVLISGKSGSGKSTLLSLLMGAEGPQMIADNGTAGEQEIDKGFRYKSEQGTLIFHDSNGVGVEGPYNARNLKCIKDFLEKRQADDDFSEQVHVVCYVASAMDNRMGEDAGLLTLLCSLRIPMLLVLTHTDEASPRKMERSRQNLHVLIEKSIKDSSVRRSLKNSIIEIGNDVEFIQPNNQIGIDSKLDKEGLKKVSDWMGRLLKSERMKDNWVASQAAYTDTKLELSAKKIATYMRMAVLSGPAAVVPFTDVVKIVLLFKKVFSTLVKIWGVPTVLENVLRKKVFRTECTDTLLYCAANDAVYLAGAAITIGVAVGTGGSLVAVLPPALATWAGTSGVMHTRTAGTYVNAFALQVVLYILYVKCRQGSSGYRWNPELTRSQCQALFDEIAASVMLVDEVKEVASLCHSIRDVAFRKKRVQRILEARMVRISNRILTGRPT